MDGNVLLMLNDCSATCNNAKKLEREAFFKHYSCIKLGILLQESKQLSLLFGNTLVC